MSNTNPPPPATKSLADLVMPPVIYRLPGMDRVQVYSNLDYSGVDPTRLLMDVYVPTGSTSSEPRPMMILVHGGAGPDLSPKDWGFFQSWGRLIAAAGMVAVTFNHRHSPPPDSLLAESNSDVRNAIDYVRANAASWHADPDRIGVCVWSIGGPLIAALLRERPTYVRCLVTFCAMLDLQQYASFVDATMLEFLKEFSPIKSLRPGTGKLSPMLILRAGRDNVPFLNDALDRFVATALAENAPITVVNHPSGEHGFENQNDDERSREIIRGALEFMKAHLAMRQF